MKLSPMSFARIEEAKQKGHLSHAESMDVSKATLMIITTIIIQIQRDYK